MQTNLGTEVISNFFHTRLHVANYTLAVDAKRNIQLTLMHTEHLVEAYIITCTLDILIFKTLGTFNQAFQNINMIIHKTYSR